MELFEWLEFLFNKWKNIDEDVVYYSAIVGLSELLKTGCTTCVDQNDSIPKKYSKTVIEKEFAAAEKLGIRLCLGRGSLDIGDDISDNLLQTVNEIINDSEDAIKKYHDSSFNSMKNIILAPCAPFCSSKICYIKTAELGRKYNVRLNTHLAETLDEEKWCLDKYGKRPLEFMKECNFIGKDDPVSGRPPTPSTGGLV
jgi:cytosine/adenosine deaminase-related metal-dependent hydrolase